MRYLKTEMLNDSRAVETYVGQDRYMHHIYSKNTLSLVSVFMQAIPSRQQDFYTNIKCLFLY